DRIPVRPLGRDPGRAPAGAAAASPVLAMSVQTSRARDEVAPMRFVSGRQRVPLYVLGGALVLAAPYLFPNWVTQLAFLWLMVVFALPWDILGGQMGYTSFGNVLFFGLGCYVTAVLQRDTQLDYFTSLAIGMIASALVAVAVAAVLGPLILGMR